MACSYEAAQQERPCTDDAIGDHFTEESAGDIAMEWDSYADESYDILCHPGITDDIYWADISRIRAYGGPPDFLMGDVGQSNLIAQNSFQDQNASSLQTMAWTPFQEKILSRNKSDERLSTSSSLTDYYSCFDSDSDEENSTERRHFDADFSTLSLCLNVSVSNGNGEPRIAITTKAEKKRPPGEIERPVNIEKEDGLLIESTESSSSLYIEDFLDIQSMVNEQNDKSFMRYRLVDIPDFDFGFALNEEKEELEDKAATSTLREDFVPSWCKIFKPLDEDTEAIVEHHDVRSLISSYESKIKEQEEECIAPTLRRQIKVKDQVYVTMETEAEKRVEMNLETNTQQRISTVTTKYEEDFTDECFQIFRKISESIIRESFEELELESRSSDIEMMGNEKIQFYEDPGENVSGLMDDTVTIKKILNIEEERINIRENNDDESLELDMAGRPLENQITTLAIQTQLISKSQEQIKNIVYTQEQLVLPSNIIIRTEEKYNEQCAVQFSGQRVPRAVYGIASLASQSTSSEEEHELEWSEHGQIVPIASVFATPLKGNISSAIRRPESHAYFTASAQNIDGNVHFQFEIAENIRRTTGNAISNILATMMHDVSPNHSFAQLYQPGIQRKRLSIQDILTNPQTECQCYLSNDDNENPENKIIWNIHEQIVPILDGEISFNTFEEEIAFLSSLMQKDLPKDMRQCSKKGPKVSREVMPLTSTSQKPNKEMSTLNERKEEQNTSESEKPYQQLTGNKTENVKSIIASFERSMHEEQRKVSFGSFKTEKKGEAIEKNTDVRKNPLSQISHKRRSKLTQDKPQPPRVELTNAQNISKVLNRVEKICSGKQQVHVQQECITNKKWYGVPPDGSNYLESKTYRAKSTNPVLPVAMSLNAVPKDAIIHGICNVQNRPEPNKEERIGQKYPQTELAGDGQKSTKLQYKSINSTVTVEYSHEQSANRSQGPTAVEHQQKTEVVECLESQSLAKYSKLVFGDGRTVYSDAKNCCKQNNVQKLCGVFEGDKLKVPQITYKISSSEAPMPAPKPQQRSIVEEENTQYANSKSSGKSHKRFDLEKYLKRRGENIVNRGSCDQNNEAYYHVAKMLTIRVIANAKLQLSREYIEKDFAKRTTTRKERRETFPNASLPPFSSFPPPHEGQGNVTQARGGTISQQLVPPQRQYMENPRTKNSNFLMEKTFPKQNKNLQVFSMKDDPQGEKVTRSLSGASGKRRGFREQDIKGHNNYHLPQMVDRDQRRKRVQFDI